MSYCGVSLVARLLSEMQELRIVLLEDPKEHQDMKLAQVLEEGKEVMANKFATIAAENGKESDGKDTQSKAV